MTDRMAEKVSEVREFREQVADMPDSYLDRMLDTEYAVEWRWNIVADEQNRRRKVRRLAREARLSQAAAVD